MTPDQMTPDQMVSALYDLVLSDPTATDPWTEQPVLDHLLAVATTRHGDPVASALAMARAAWAIDHAAKRSDPLTARN